jgi:hypothetical protein
MPPAAISPVTLASTLRNAADPIDKTLLQMSKPHDKRRGHANRKKKRTSQQTSKPGQLPRIRPSIQAKYLHGAPAIQTNLKTETLPVASTAFVANEGSSGKRIYTAEELIGKNAKTPFKLVRWNGT